MKIYPKLNKEEKRFLNEIKLWTKINDGFVVSKHSVNELLVFQKLVEKRLIVEKGEYKDIIIYRSL